MFTHTCIKPGCSTQYQDEDPEPYYCPACKAEKAEIAKTIDAQFASRPKEKVVTPLQEYEQAQKIRGFMPVKFN